MTERPARASMTTSPTAAAQQQVVQAESRRSSLGSRLAERNQRLRSLPADPVTPSGGSFHDRDGYRNRDGFRGDRTSWRPSYVHARYYDRPDLIRHDYHHMYTYYDHDYRLHHRVIWPDYYYPVCYSFGHDTYFHHVYPYYHRKYVFISLGGWWPQDYSYVRYYWYGYHPYLWYGYYPIAREVTGDSYNYYTYNYYQNDDGSYTGYSSDTAAASQSQPVDQSTWADVRGKLDKQNAQPAAQTVADTRFEEGVKSFEGGEYGAAAEKFEQAMQMSPNDMILPFAYAQALFADGQYTQAAKMLRVALDKVSPEKEGVFYPRGLYANDDVLYAQIEDLVDKLEKSGDDADMQLLLGYHLLGVGETGYAREPLERAGQDAQNAEAVKVLTKLADKIESEAQAAKKTQGVIVEESKDVPLSEAQIKAEAVPSPKTETTTGDVQQSNIPGIVPALSDPNARPQAAPEAGKTKETPSADQASPVTEKKDSDATPAVPPDNGGTSGKGPASLNEAGVALMSSPASLWTGASRYLRADFAGFAGIVLLGWTGVYMQWRHLGRA